MGQHKAKTTWPPKALETSAMIMTAVSVISVAGTPPPRNSPCTSILSLTRYELIFDNLGQECKVSITPAVTETAGWQNTMWHVVTWPTVHEDVKKKQTNKQTVINIYWPVLQWQKLITKTWRCPQIGDTELIRISFFAFNILPTLEV